MAEPLRVNPNRMELLRLRRRRDVARRGHKLLKDKLDELVKELLARVAEVRELRRDVELHLREAQGLFAVARAEAGSQLIAQALLAGDPVDLVGAAERRVMGVPVPDLECTGTPPPHGYSLATTPAILDEALGGLRDVLPLLVELAERETTIELLAAEIERTRRRVNALEHVLIPQLDATIRHVQMKLDEAERSDLTRLMKVKELVAEERG